MCHNIGRVVASNLRTDVDHRIQGARLLSGTIFSRGFSAVGGAYFTLPKIRLNLTASTEMPGSCTFKRSAETEPGSKCEINAIASNAFDFLRILFIFYIQSILRAIRFLRHISNVAFGAIISWCLV
jgi:hypothetical protein